MDESDVIDKFDGRYLFLSNFYRLDPPLLGGDGYWYWTTEHAFQAMKCLYAVDRDMIRMARTPGEAKKIGRKVKLRPGWDGMRNQVMLRITRKKFQRPALRQQLVATGEDKLIEGNLWGDRYWGMTLDTRTGKLVGRNQLGKTLMKVRKEVIRDGGYDARDDARHSAGVQGAGQGAGPHTGDASGTSRRGDADA